MVCSFPFSLSGSAADEVNLLPIILFGSWWCKWVCSTCTTVPATPVARTTTTFTFTQQSNLCIQRKGWDSDSSLIRTHINRWLSVNTPCITLHAIVGCAADSSKEPLKGHALWRYCSPFDCCCNSRNRPHYSWIRSDSCGALSRKEEEGSIPVLSQVPIWGCLKLKIHQRLPRFVAGQRRRFRAGWFRAGWFRAGWFSANVLSRWWPL